MLLRNKILLLLFCTPLFLRSQPASYNFRHLTTSDGLGDGIIRGIAQDKFGFMWFGSVNGLTIYNGYSCKLIESDAHNPFALKDIAINSLCTDKNGNIWLAQASGLYEYEYSTGHFLFQPVTSGLSIYKILPGKDEYLYIASREGLKLFNTETKRFSLAPDAESQLILNRPVRDICCGDKKIYLATEYGIVVLDCEKRNARILNNQDRMKGLTRISIDKTGTIWCSDDISLYKLDKKNNLTIYPELKGIKQLNPDNHVNDLMVDETGRLWIATTRTGLCLYNEKTDNFISFKNDPLLEKSVSSNLINSLFQGRDGTIWLGTEGYGLSYFNPERAFFHSLLPSSQQSPTLPDNWCRDASQDAYGQWWLATATGVAVYNPALDVYKIFQSREDGRKDLYINSVRSVLCSGDGTVWIGTAGGLNRYHPKNNQMDFIGEKEKMPLSFSGILPRTAPIKFGLPAGMVSIVMIL